MNGSDVPQTQIVLVVGKCGRVGARRRRNGESCLPVARDARHTLAAFLLALLFVACGGDRDLSHPSCVSGSEVGETLRPGLYQRVAPGPLAPFGRIYVTETSLYIDTRSMGGEGPTWCREPYHRSHEVLVVPRLHRIGWSFTVNGGEIVMSLTNGDVVRFSRCQTSESCWEPLRNPVDCGPP